MPYIPASPDIRSCRRCGLAFVAQAVNVLDCSPDCRRQSRLLNAQGSKKERKAKRRLFDSLRPGSLRALEKL